MASMVFYDPSQGVLEGDLSGKIAVMRRDGEPISVKARKAQASGAIGAVVVDSGACTGFNQQCLPGSDKDKGELFAEIDPPKSWSKLRIPVVFSLKDSNASNFFNQVVDQTSWS